MLSCTYLIYRYGSSHLPIFAPYPDTKSNKSATIPEWHGPRRWRILYYCHKCRHDVFEHAWTCAYTFGMMRAAWDTVDMMQMFVGLALGGGWVQRSRGSAFCSFIARIKHESPRPPLKSNVCVCVQGQVHALRITHYDRGHREKAVSVHSCSPQCGSTAGSVVLVLGVKASFKR